MRVDPIDCWRPTPTRAASFASLPYDVFDRAQARAYVERHPDSFLAIDRPETAFPPDHDMYAVDVYAKAAELLRARASDGTLLHDTAACYYLYRLEQDGHAQVGVVGACSIDEYEDGTILRHENTTAAKERDRIRHIEATGAQTGPILLTYHDDVAVDTLCDLAATGEPLYDFTDEEGVRQTVWRIARPAAVEALRATFATIPHAYIADGHHRAASAVRVGKRQRAEARARGEGGPLPSDLFLAVLVPASQLRVLPYNRVVADACGLSTDELTARIAAQGFVVDGPTESFREPARTGQIALYAGGRWHMLHAPRGTDDPCDPVASLDTQVLQERVLGPILQVRDPRTSSRIRFVGGIEGPGRLEGLAGTDGVAFWLHPTSVEQLMAVSDAGMLMPPKSTWFEPKLRSGLFIRGIREGRQPPASSLLRVPHWTRCR